MTPSELFAKELMTYDVGTDSRDKFYNSLPYKKDYDLCNWKPLREFSGNIIKYYQYQMDKPVVLCTDPGDGEFSADTAFDDMPDDMEPETEEPTDEMSGEESEQSEDFE
jgi:hypothetical protein